MLALIWSMRWLNSSMLYNSPKEPHNEGFRNGKREKVAQEEVDGVMR
jgi:hypothetical protein